VAMDIAICMEYLHEKKIVRLDLKSEHLILIPRGHHRPIFKVLVNTVAELAKDIWGGGAVPPLVHSYATAHWLVHTTISWHAHILVNNKVEHIHTFFMNMLTLSIKPCHLPRDLV
jgi:hypothetical protein